MTWPCPSEVRLGAPGHFHQKTERVERCVDAGAHAPSFSRAAPGLPSSWGRRSQPSYGNPAGVQSRTAAKAQGTGLISGHVSKSLKLPGPQFPRLQSGNKIRCLCLRGLCGNWSRCRDWDPLGTRALHGHHSSGCSRLETQASLPSPSCPLLSLLSGAWKWSSKQSPDRAFPAKRKRMS